MLWISVGYARDCARAGSGEADRLFAACQWQSAAVSPTKRCCMQRRLVIIGLLLRLGVRGLLHPTRRLRPLQLLQSR